MIAKVLLLLASGAMLAGNAHAEGAVRLCGRIQDTAGGPVAAEIVTLSTSAGESVASRRTGPNGNFCFHAPQGSYVVAAQAPGLRPFHGAVAFSPGGEALVVLQEDSAAGALVQPAQSTRFEAYTVSHTRPVWEYGLLAQAGTGVTDNRGSVRFLMAGAHLGRMLTPDVGPGVLHGNFEYAVEVFPFWQVYTPKFQRLSCPAANACSGPFTTGGTYTGASVTPILLRWNFTSSQKFQPWLQGGGGVIWTNHKFPAVGNLNPADVASNGYGGNTSVWNFSPQFGVGVHMFRGDAHSIDFAANALHISSASLGDKNPGINASVQFNVGYTWWK